MFNIASGSWSLNYFSLKGRKSFFLLQFLVHIEHAFAIFGKGEGSVNGKWVWVLNQTQIL